MLVYIDPHDLLMESTTPCRCLVLRMLLCKYILQIFFQVMRNTCPRFIGVFAGQEGSSDPLCIDGDGVVRILGGITSMNRGFSGKECADAIIHREWKLSEGLQERRFAAASATNSNQLIDFSVLNTTGWVKLVFVLTWGSDRLLVSI